MIANEFADPIELHPTLNPKLWNGEHLNPDVKKALMRIARDFKQYIGVPFRVVDVQVAGGNANYTYTEFSDLDLHLIADFTSVQCDREAAELFDSKRLLYKSQYDVNVNGVPVELYVEDLDHPAVSSSYSIVQNKWIRAPKKEVAEIDREELARMTSIWHTVIQHAIKTADRQNLSSVLKLLRKYRKLGLAQSGEFGTPNLVYKSLRNDDTIKGLTKLLDRLHSQELSIG
jgi:hypothetical protein